MKDFELCGAITLLDNYYNSSLLKLLQTHFPNFDWLPWKFGKVPNNYWNDKKNVKKYLENVKNELKIDKMQDWYKITVKVEISVKFHSLNKRN